MQSQPLHRMRFSQYQASSAAHVHVHNTHHPCLLYHIFDTITPNENYAFLNLTITLVLILDLQSILRFESGYRASTITQLPHPVAMKVSECWRIEQVIV